MDLFMNEIYCTEQSFDSITFFSIVLFFCVKLAIPTKKFILEGCICKV